MKRLLPLVLLCSCSFQASPLAGRDAAEADPYLAGVPTVEDGNFEDTGSNPFLRASDAPFSTFGVDVDTASYQYFLRTAKNGQLPEPGSVRTEDFINYFGYDYARPEGEVDRLALDAVAARGGLGRNTSLLRVTLTAPPQTQGEKRPANLVYLVDVSGSMSGADRIDLVKATLKESLAVLDPTDKISIVTYAGNTSVRLTPTPVSEKNAIIGAIDGLVAGGSTAGSAGLDLAYQQATAGFIPGGINHVLLCTDGDFNVGPYSDEELVQQIKTKRESGVTLTVLGFGMGNYRGAMMEKISNAGNGVAGYIGDIDQATTYVHERMLSTFDHVASDAKVQLEFNPSKVLAYRLIGYENRLLSAEDFRNDAVDAGEIGAGHRVTALYEVAFVGEEVPPVLEEQSCKLVPPAPESVPESEISAEAWLLVKVRYKDSRDLTALREQHISLVEAPAPFENASADLQYATAVAALAELLKLSPFADAERLPQIEEILTAQAERDRDRGELASLFPGVREQLQARAAADRPPACTFAAAE